MNPFKLCVHFVLVDCFMLHNQWASLMAQLVKNPPAMQETWVQSLGWEDLLEEGMETHSSILAWRIPMGKEAWQATVHRVEQLSSVAKSRTQLSTCWIWLPSWLSGKESAYQYRRCGFNPWVGKISWGRKWQPTPVFLPGECPWTEEPGRLQSMGSQRVRHN